MSEKILCAVDGSAQRRAVARVAAALSGALSQDLVYVHATEDPSSLPPGAIAARERARNRRLDGAREQVRLAARDAGPPGAQTEARLGDAADEVLEAAEEHEATCIVVGCRGLGSLRSLLSPSVSDEVLRRSSRPVVMVPPGLAGDSSRALAGKSVVCGVDDSEKGEWATETAVAIARALRLELVLVHLPRPAIGVTGALGPRPVPAGGALVDEPPAALVKAGRAAANHVRSVTAHVVPGPAHEALARCAAEEEAALVVVGRDGSRAGRSLARRLGRDLTVPVMSVGPGVEALRAHGEA